jgi:hypothetical protein
MTYRGMPKSASQPTQTERGNPYGRKPGRTKEQPIASGVRKDTGCINKDRWGKRCGEPLAEDSFAYCEECKIEIRRSV